MSKTPDIDKAYVSPYDRFLRAFDAKHAPSTSQQQEKTKHDKIFKQRDQATTEAKD
jgi:hypothetical protein